MSGATGSDVKPCPFCGDQPYFTGDVGEWQDGSRYVELSLGCCATMTDAIGWKRARDMSVREREVELKARLTTKWNKRAPFPEGMRHERQAA